MADVTTMSAQARDGSGKGAARALRREGRTPAVIYGAKKDPASISVDPAVLLAEVSKRGFFATLIDLDIDGSTERVLCRDVQMDPLKDKPIHADFLRVTPTTRLNVEVPVSFINEEECPGLSEGGVLNVVRRTVELSALAASIPNTLVIDLEGKVIGDSIHISDIELPEGVHPTIADRDFTVATVAAPTVIPVEEEEVLEGEEGEEGEGVEGEEGEGVEGEEGEEASEDGKKTQSRGDDKS
ncbi:MAG: 50S ribosomal protein L25/general stress protein Ctc [Alphaproteobacteria bacterium]|nr:50S ribosomal protein L25/general stress protein Ctc [Alphaproteobacteria bacterium]MCZ6764286.1 50S ribosomal protein L25/general stress protein Ctc [Alphaproteobacteria bacterium]